jgi:tetratricopeptide (TPR) repeat protein
MSGNDSSKWMPKGEVSEGDSIAELVASRIETPPTKPGDALDWAAVAARYEREALALGERPGAAELLFEAGRVYEERLLDPESALAFYRRSLASGRRLVPNLRALARLAAARGELALAAEAVGAELEVLAEPHARAALLRERAHLLDGLGQAEEARALRVRADELTPDSLESALASIEAGLLADDTKAQLSGHLRCAAVPGDPRRAAHHLLAASALAADRLGDLPHAAALALDAFDLCPTDPLVRSAARLHASRAGGADRLVLVLRAGAEAAAGETGAQALLELARAEERAGQTDRAVASLERAWTLAPDHPRVLSELARLREERGEWAEAADALEGLAAAHLSHGGVGHRMEAVAA